MSVKGRRSSTGDWPAAGGQPRPGAGRTTQSDRRTVRGNIDWEYSFYTFYRYIYMNIGGGNRIKRVLMFKWNDYKYLFVGMEEVAIST